MQAVRFHRLGGPEARVLGTVSSDRKAVIARQMGADATVNYRADDLEKAIRDFTDGRGADLVLDGIGEPVFAAGLASLAPFDRLLLFGRAGGAPNPFDPMQLLRRSASVGGFSLPMVYADRPLMRASINAIAALKRRGALQIMVDSIKPMADAATALAMLAAGGTIGKVLLRQAAAKPENGE